MLEKTIKGRNKKMADRCMNCNICNLSRNKQRGLALWFAKNVEEKPCPYCKAYAKIQELRTHNSRSHQQY